MGNYDLHGLRVFSEAVSLEEVVSEILSLEVELKDYCR